MPLWLIKYLPYGLLALALAFGVWYLDHQGYKRAQNETQLINAKHDALVADMKRELHESMTAQLVIIDARLSGRLSAINSNNAVTTAALNKEIANDPHYTAPAAGISDSVRQQLNAARLGDQRPRVVK